MFGNLKEYKQNVDFYKENPVVKFTTEYETNEYLIYGYFVTHVRPEQHSSGEVFHYHDYIEVLNDEYTFNWYVNEVQKRNQIVSPVDVEYGDKLLCLSTCSNEFSDSRFVVFARMLRDGESVDDYDFSEAYMNYNAQGVDWDAIMSGETTTIPENAVNNKKKNRNEITAEITRAETAETKAAETDAEETETPAETEVPVSEETSEAVTETAAS